MDVRDGSVKDDQEIRFRFGNGVQLPPFRTIDDFLLNKARFDMPPYTDLPKWNNRIIANLLYYQTNYFAVFFAAFIIQSLLNAQDLVLGLSAICAVLAVVVFSTSTNPTFYQTRRDHPMVTLGAIVIAFYYFITMIASVAVVTFSVLFPVLLILIHASVRIRGLLNKITQAAERTGLRITVMGRILDVCGLSVKA